MKDLPLLLFICLSFYLIFFLQFKDNTEIPNSNQNNIFEKKVEKQEFILKEINKNKKNITSILIKSLFISDKTNRIQINTQGFLAYQKEKNFRMILNSVFGKEVDIGSNDLIFWYWSKRSVDKFLYYSKHENIEKTRLKDPLNPDFLKHILLIDEIPKENIIDILENDEFYLIKWQLSSFNDKKILDCVLKIFKNNYKPKDFYLYDKKNLVISCNILNTLFYNDIYLPQKIIIKWPNENIQMSWEIKDLQINALLNEFYWQLPNIKNKKNIGVD